MLGDSTSLLQGLVLAFGGALFLGNVLAIVKPPKRGKQGSLARAPIARTAAMAVIGFIVSVWALASMLR